MTTLQLQHLLGQRGLVQDARRKIQYEVNITDVRQCNFGRVELLCAPIAGKGLDWICLENITVTTGQGFEAKETPETH